MLKNETTFTKFLLAGCAIAALSFSSCVKNIDTNSINAESISSEAVANENNGQEFVPNQLLIKFKENVPESAKTKLLSRINANVVEKILTRTMQRHNSKQGVLLVNTPLAVLEAKSKINSDEIEFAEPNFIYQHHSTANDTYYKNGSQWGVLGDGMIPSNVYGSQANEAWGNGNTGSSAVHIGVIDEGAMYNHADLAGQIWTNPFDRVDGVDNDGNGYVDDVHGWDFDKNDNTTFDGNEDDHGTHVSGTIGATGGNGFGVAGVTWSVKMITVKFLGRRGGTTANAIKAVDYITDLKKRHNLLLPATNNSWGGGGFSKALSDAIERAKLEGILFVAAAGNGGNDGVGDNNDASPHYPASYPNENIIAVASITSSGARSGFSNYGATSVDIGAPGSSIISTVPGKNLSSAYGSYSGTSMATPHVTGGIALYVASHQGATLSQVRSAIIGNAVGTSSLTNRCTTGGRLNVSSF